MKVRKSAGRGPFREQPFFKPIEIENICEEALRKVELMPSSAEPIRIERFIEKRFGLTPEYSALPAGILGYTIFGSNGPSAMVIAQMLADAGTVVAERRINTTLAHEAGHCLLHSHLFALADMPLDLFRDEEVHTDKPKILCRDVPVGAYDGKWWEFQANAAIGPLLMPAGLVTEVVEGWLERGGLLGIPQIPLTARVAAAQAVSTQFDVNPVAAKIRLEQLFPKTNQTLL
ncbi:ImmA/IrrE family metallo-endopeptidase [Acidicapsa acidisoli]|uniref:ImmA/IrrE family metallo-endopeptidase n=1 Tax=Acidicapsa acidisoli TaxID=1615681 RepID=UPI0021E09667|nr:hypothetical protein [Acidicapsa acidisoli]